MSFISNIVSAVTTPVRAVAKVASNVVTNIAQAVGLAPKIPQQQVIVLPSGDTAVAPTQANSYQQMDQAAQASAASVSRGRTSTQLTGAQGEEEDKLNTSKVLLGQ